MWLPLPFPIPVPGRCHPNSAADETSLRFARTLLGHVCKQADQDRRLPGARPGRVAACRQRAPGNGAAGWAVARAPAGIGWGTSGNSCRCPRFPRVYRGLGTWIDIYDVAWRHPGTAVRRMRARGVETLYLETSNFSRGRMMVFPDGVRRFLDAAHRNGVSVVAWYLPGLRDLALDVHRSLGAIRYRTPLGNGFDSFALDIESDAVDRPVRRTRRLLSLSERLRGAVGRSYPLGAIIPSPRRLQADVLYWPYFPYQRLADVYDVFLPMTYFT